MSWFHTWAGIVLSGLLFAIFWMGTLSVFDHEIDRWMAPMTRLPPPANELSLDELGPAVAMSAAVTSPFLAILLPNERQPFVRLSWREKSGLASRYLDPTTGRQLPDPGTWAGTRFIYPFHYMLHVRPLNIGIWIVGLAAMAMLLLCVSGAVIHRKFFADFFMMRTTRKPRRLLLDLHNVAGSLALPFHVTIALSGLIVFWALYFPGSLLAVYSDRASFDVDAFGTFARPKQHQPGDLVSLDVVVAEARRLWAGDWPRTLVVRHPGDAAAYIQVVHPNDRRVTDLASVAYFDGATGLLLHQRSSAGSVVTAQRFIGGLHEIQFHHWTLRWLYFGLGLLGCVLIATGSLFWLESRRRKHVRRGLRSVAIVEGLTTGSVTGIVIATLAFFVVNRLLPLGATFFGQDRAALEIWTFYLVWLATFGHAWLRPEWAWRAQCAAIAALAVVAVLLNWITTGDHLARSLGHHHLWPIAGMDLMLLAGAAIAALAAIRLKNRDSRIPSTERRHA